MAVDRLTEEVMYTRLVQRVRRKAEALASQKVQDAEESIDEPERDRSLFQAALTQCAKDYPAYKEYIETWGKERIIQDAMGELWSADKTLRHARYSSRSALQRLQRVGRALQQVARDLSTY